MPKQYTHDLSLYFTVDSDDVYGLDIGTEDVRAAIHARLKSAGNLETQEMVLPPLHTIRNFPLPQSEWRKNPEICPLCGASHTQEGNGVEVEETTMYQQRHCTACKGSFTVEFSVSRYNSHKEST